MFVKRKSNEQIPFSLSIRLDNNLPAFCNANTMAQGNEQHCQTVDLTNTDDLEPFEGNFPGCEDREFPNHSALK
jgi:hypothetical protein